MTTTQKTTQRRLTLKIRDTGKGIPKKRPAPYLRPLLPSGWQHDEGRGGEWYRPLADQRNSGSDRRGNKGEKLGRDGYGIYGLLAIQNVTRTEARATPVTRTEVRAAPAVPAAPIVTRTEVRAANAINAPANPALTNDSLPKLLLIEDNPDVVAYLATCLHDQYTLLVGKDGQEGIEIALDRIPDIIITDVMMPRKDGFRSL